MSYLASWSCFVTQSRPSFACQTDCPTSDHRILRYTKKFKIKSMTAGPQVLWLPNKSKSSSFPHCAWQLVWDVCADVLCLGFSKHGYGQISPIWLPQVKDFIVPEVLWFFQMQFCKLKLCCNILLETFPNKPNLVSVVIIVLSWAL